MAQVDTGVFNAQTTAADVLWAAVPVVTIPGERFVGRVGASLAAAMPNGVYVARDQADYIRLASAFISRAASGESTPVCMCKLCRGPPSERRIA